ncbi:hypothetical protein AB0M20_11870 [Actinoplanes sp. NPDC051633]|uniref:hypothetical protein n=1 Tax=Actinoplanes sp. NPDC051633 TaxID=3155670 RepID=UPI00341BD90C
MTAVAGRLAARVEAAWLDRGDGLRRWYVVQVGNTVAYLRSLDNVSGHLAAHGLAGRDLQPLDDGLPGDEDGCE